MTDEELTAAAKRGYRAAIVYMASEMPRIVVPEEHTWEMQSEDVHKCWRHVATAILQVPCGEGGMCDVCQGSGAMPWDGGHHRCTRCGGSGKLRSIASEPVAPFDVAQAYLSTSEETDHAK